MFCIRHANEHRTELSIQLEIVVYEHDSIQQQLSQSSSDHVLLQKINKEWRTQLSELRNNIDSAISCNLIKDKRSPIYIIKIEADNAVNQILKKQLSYKVDDRFCLIRGPVQLDCNAMRSIYVGDDDGYGRIRGQQKYSQSRSM
ncbi:unnamed protein product, partial [Rotaria magnacalcarata]